MTARIIPYGDAAVLVELGDAVDPALSARVDALVRALEQERATGEPWGRAVPAYASVLVPLDPLTVDTAEVIERLRAIVDGSAPDPSGGPDQAGDPLVIEVRYGGDDGPDLAEVARATGMSEGEVVAAHTGTTYRVAFLGFAPGFGYLGTLPESIAVPRRTTPRMLVPAGSVAIAGRQTAVYPLSTPGGWQLIGRTDAPLWDPRRDPPSLLRAGGLVRFRALGGE